MSEMKLYSLPPLAEVDSFGNCCDNLPLSAPPPKQSSAQERFNTLAAAANDRAGVSTDVPHAGMGGNASAHRNRRHTQEGEVRLAEQL